MAQPTILQSFTGPFCFFRPSDEEVAKLWPNGIRGLPDPQRVLLLAEDSTPIQAFPILISEHLESLAHALQTRILTEEKNQVLRALAPDHWQEIQRNGRVEETARQH